MRDVVPVSPRGVAQRGGSYPTMGGGASYAINLGRLLAQTGNGWEPTGKVNYSGPLHLVLFGPNGSGKSTRILVPNLLTMFGKSVVVIDPKGQLALMTAERRHRMGDDVRIIDPFGVVKEIAEARPRDYGYLLQHGLAESAGFNPLAALDPDSRTFFDDAAVIAEALIKIQGNDPHWSESAQGLVTGLVMWERKEAGRAGNLEHVRELLTQADEFESYLGEDGKLHKRQVAGLRVTAARMVALGGFEISSLASRFAAGHFTDELESIRSTADTQTRWLLSQPMRVDLKKPGVDFRLLKRGPRPMSVYVVLPANYLETHSVWLRLVISEALRASMQAGGRRTLLMLEEFAALGHLSIVERLFGVTRDYGIQMWPIFQDLPQLKGLYRERWETLLGMAGAVQSFRTGDFTTAEWVSKRAGSDTVVAAGYNSHTGHAPGGANTGSGMNWQQVEVPFIRPELLFGLEAGWSLAWMAGQQAPIPLFSPIYSKSRV